MKTLITLLLLTCSIVSYAQVVDTIIVLDPNNYDELVYIENSRKQLIESGKMVANKKEGNWIAYRQPDSVFQSITPYKAGKKHGLALTFSKRMELAVEEHYEADVLQGIRRKYERGRVRVFETYKDGKLHGLMQTFYVNGKLQESSRYNNGVKDGLSQWFYDNEQLLTEYVFQAGAIEGVVKSYYKEGGLKSEANYKNNDFDGLYQSYYADGTLKMKGNYIAGNKEGKWQHYDENGKQNKQETYKKGVLIKSK